jgi:hypothetical protein
LDLIGFFITSIGVYIATRDWKVLYRFKAKL